MKGLYMKQVIICISAASAMSLASFAQTAIQEKPILPASSVNKEIKPGNTAVKFSPQNQNTPGDRATLSTINADNAVRFKDADNSMMPTNRITSPAARPIRTINDNDSRPITNSITSPGARPIRTINDNDSRPITNLITSPGARPIQAFNDETFSTNNNSK